MDKDCAPRFVSRAQLKGAFMANAERHDGRIAVYYKLTTFRSRGIGDVGCTAIW